MPNEKEDKLKTSAENFVAAFLEENPEFFRNHIDLFCKMVPPRQNKDGTRSVIECQNEVLRASLSIYELKEQDAKDLKAEAEQLHEIHVRKAIAFGQHLCSIDRPEILPDIILGELMRFFGVCKGIVRLWNLEAKFQHLKAAMPVTPIVQAQISSMREPYSGENFGTEIAMWTNSRPEETGGVFLAPFFNPEGKVF